MARLLAILASTLAILQLASGQCAGSTASLVATGTPQNLTGPAYPSSYTASQSCSWLITPDTGYTQLKLSVIAFDTEASVSGCGVVTHDYVIVMDGTSLINGFQKGCLSDSLATVTGQGLSELSTEINNKFFIQFESDSDGTVGTGFYFQYWALETESDSALTTIHYIAIGAGGLALIVIVIVIVAVVIWKKKKARIEELEWEYCSDDSYDYYTDSDYDDVDGEARPEGGSVPAPSHPAPLPSGVVAGARQAAVPGQPDYKAPNALPPLNGIDVEKARRRQRRRRRRVKKPTTEDPGRGSVAASVATARDVHVLNEAPKDDLAELEEEIAQEAVVNKSTAKPTAPPQDSLFDNAKFAPAKG